MPLCLSVEASEYDRPMSQNDPQVVQNSSDYYHEGMEYRHRLPIDSLPGYQQGRPAPEASGLVPYKISSNENPYPPLDAVQRAIADQSLVHLNRYPDMRGNALVERLARLHGVDPENIQLGCGSTEVITQLVTLVAGAGDEVIYPWRSFEAYPIIVTSAGATCLPIPLDEHGRQNIDAMIQAVTDQTRLVIVNNPNNPTATSVSREEALRLLDALPRDVLVLFDEAYFQFNDDPDQARGLELMKDYPNIVVARTFSKAYGLAGLRIGYAVAPSEVVQGLSKVALPFGVSDVAQTAALVSLDVSDQLEERVENLIQERTRVIGALEDQGWHIPTPRANYFWLPLGQSTNRAYEEFRDRGLSVRAFPGEGIRISIGETEAMDRVIQVCSFLMEEGLAPQD